jgi:putative transcriptional regulator
MIGTRVRLLRERYDMSQVALAESIGVMQSTISNIETGYAKPSLKTAIKLASVFHVSLDELLSSEDELDVAATPTPA